MASVFNVILAVVAWPFRTFPKTTFAVLLLLAGGGAGMASSLHNTGMNVFHEFNTVFCGKPNCFSGVKIPGKH